MPLAAGNLTWDWALDTLVAQDREAALDTADRLFAQRLLPPEKLVAFPWLTQPNPDSSDTHGAGAFLGLNTGASRADLVRAVAAGMAFELARVFQQVASSGQVDKVILAGGAANGRCFRTLIAALFDSLPVVWQRDSDIAAARGAVTPLGTKPMRTKTTAIQRPDRALRDQVKRAYEPYARVLAKIYPQPPSGGPYRVVAP
jgi:sugar (pentulose or hexulose) kinase